MSCTLLEKNSPLTKEKEKKEKIREQLREPYQHVYDRGEQKKKNCSKSMQGTRKQPREHTNFPKSHDTG